MFLTKNTDILFYSRDFRLIRTGYIYNRYTYRSRATNVWGVCLWLLDKRLDLISCVVTSIIMSTNDGFNDLRVIVHFRHYFWFLSLLTRWLHSSQNFGLFAFRNAAKSYSWNEKDMKLIVLKHLIIEMYTVNETFENCKNVT